MQDKLTNYILSDDCVIEYYTGGINDFMLLDTSTGRFVDVSNIQNFYNKAIHSITSLSKSLIGGLYCIAGVSVFISPSTRKLMITDDTTSIMFSLPLDLFSAIIRSKIGF